MKVQLTTLHASQIIATNNSSRAALNGQGTLSGILHPDKLHNILHLESTLKALFDRDSHSSETRIDGGPSQEI